VTDAILQAGARGSVVLLATLLVLDAIVRGVLAALSLSDPGAFSRDQGSFREQQRRLVAGGRQVFLPSIEG
jgi:uncharacterized protein with ACT and thioredoxin-like domain